MADLLKRIGNWFLGKADMMEQLDENVKAAVNLQTKRALGIGFGLGVIVTVVVVRVVG
ncbi:hypothetical protein P22_3978 [Propionispora sp. 2/2-37]|uniref:hypothetical protein n=1 Tax=Propionispora sp. 2/2-37 TaxID=1677858 RepID=UPI0006C23288|nr:hypothetical protein [Propionispora sp. 2/2-37]CUH97832.1 hypothetical protein P22_3978 [Propionispora sp. 2/2-37]